ncbi:MAG: ferredoxin--NADP reductase [Cytophagales bacterium]|nr:ferredoxin--NADP reductase [Cytophagales bacterium]
MNINPIELTVKQVTNPTKDSCEVIFEQTQIQVPYISGQFITLHIPMDGSILKRSYSLCSSCVTDTNLAICVKQTSNAYTSKYILQNIKPGQKYKADPPMGNFVLHGNENIAHIVLIGAGSGITPLLSIIKTALKNNIKTTLIYGNRAESDIIYHHTLLELESRYGSIFNVIYFLSQPHDTWVGYKGRINEASAVQIIQKYAGTHLAQTHFYICGPAEMMQDVAKGIDILGVNKENVHRELFHAASPNVNAHTPAHTATSKVKIIDGNKTYEFEVDKKNTILETGLKLGYPLPYSCQSGMCTACMGTCIEGKVDMNDPDGLTPKEIEQGYVLTCVGRPTTDVVVIKL